MKKRGQPVRRLEPVVREIVLPAEARNAALGRKLLVLRSLQGQRCNRGEELLFFCRAQKFSLIGEPLREPRWRGAEQVQVWHLHREHMFQTMYRYDLACAGGFVSERALDTMTRSYA